MPTASSYAGSFESREKGREVPDFEPGVIESAAFGASGRGVDGGGEVGARDLSRFKLCALAGHFARP